MSSSLPKPDHLPPNRLPNATFTNKTWIDIFRTMRKYFRFFFVVTNILLIFAAYKVSFHEGNGYCRKRSAFFYVHSIKVRYGGFAP
jgi:hypothetical protein